MSTYRFQYQVRIKGSIFIDAATEDEAGVFFRKITKYSLMQNMMTTPLIGPTKTVIDTRKL